MKRKNVLAIGAHFDDIELGCGGTLVKHLNEGDNVTMLYVTHGEYHNFDGTLLRSKEAALTEGSNGARVLGVKPEDFICLGHETKKVQYGVELIEQINKIIADRRIDTIFTHWTLDVHQDHSAIARATLNAGRHVPRILMYQSNWYIGQEAFNGRFYVDISDFLERKLESLRQHKGELELRGEKWLDFIRHQARNCGTAMETQYAEQFQIVKYLA